MVQDQDETTFLGALTDFSFDSFVSVKLIRVLYILALVVGVFITVVGVVIAFTNGIMSGIFGIIFAPLFFLVFAVIVRVWARTHDRGLPHRRSRQGNFRQH